MNNPNLLSSVQKENIRNNQIGGQTDGITPEVAADIGFETPEQMERILAGETVSPLDVIGSATQKLSTHRPGVDPTHYLDEGTRKRGLQAIDRIRRDNDQSPGR